MSNSIWRLARVLLIGFGLVALGLVYWQVLQAPSLLAREDNPRRVIAEQRVRRGRLLDRDGNPLAYSQVLPITALQDVVRRHYALPAAAPAVGYYSLRYGVGGAEAAFDARLRGQSGIWDRLLHRPPVGEDVTLSLLWSAQVAADRALGSAKGAVLAMDVVSGGIWVMVSHPTYDPNQLDEEWEGLVADPDAPLLNRSTQGLYPVGDLARLVGLAGLLSAGTTVPPDPLQAPLEAMLAPLSRLGYLATARQLGFDQAPGFDLPTVAGRLPDLYGKDTPRDLVVTPLHMVHFMAAVAGDGQLPQARLAHPARPAGVERALSPQVASTLRSVSPRRGDLAVWCGVVTPKETGGAPLSWLAGYAPAEVPYFALVVVVENSSIGEMSTLPVAQQVWQALKDGAREVARH